MRLGIGERITLLRRRLGLSQPDLAKKLDDILGEPPPRQATMSAWETGRSEPKLLEALALVQALETTLDVLAGRSPVPPVVVRTSDDAA